MDINERNPGHKTALRDMTGNELMNKHASQLAISGVSSNHSQINTGQENMTPSQRRLLHTNLKHMSPSLGCFEACLTHQSPVGSLLAQSIGDKGKATMFQLPTSGIRGRLHGQCTIQNNDFNTICIKKNDNGHEPDLSMNTSQPDAQNSSYVDPDQDEITIVVPEFEAMGVERPCNVFFEMWYPKEKGPEVRNMLSSLNDASHTITRLDLRDDVRSHNGQASSSSTLTNSQHVLSDKNVPDHDNEYPDSEATISVGDYEIVESPLSLLYLNEFITDVVTKSM
ncbi:hypothetical protein ACET3Z_021233 [Daucus carota]